MALGRPSCGLRVECGRDRPDALRQVDVAATPIELTFSAFRPDIGPEVRTVTATGPVVTVLQTNCGDPVASAPWTFTAAAQTGDGLACSSFYGGKHLASDSDFAEGDSARGASVDCSGHPGM